MIRLMQMAWRNVWRNTRRSLVTIAAMTLALFVMVLWTGFMQGMLRDLENTILEVEMGDVQIHASDYRERPSLYTVIAEPDGLTRELESAGYRVSPRLLGGALAASQTTSAGAMVTGIDLVRDASVSTIGERTEAGAWLSPDDPMGAVIGSRLARKLELTVGDELILLGQATDGSTANELYTVRGILELVSDGIDRAGVFLPAPAFRDFFWLEEGAHRLVVRRPPGSDLEEATALISRIAGASRAFSATEDGLEVRNWRRLAPTLATYLDTTTQAMAIAYAVIYFAIAILILNAMLMAVFERIRELGVMKAIGVSPSQLLRMIFLEGLLQTFVAIGLGLALAVPLCLHYARKGLDVSGLMDFSFEGVRLEALWFPVTNAVTFVAPVLALLFLVFVAILYPGLKAARISPVEAMRYQ